MTLLTFPTGSFFSFILFFFMATRPLWHFPLSIIMSSLLKTDIMFSLYIENSKHTYFKLFFIQFCCSHFIWSKGIFILTTVLTTFLALGFCTRSLEFCVHGSCERKAPLPSPCFLPCPVACLELLFGSQTWIMSVHLLGLDSVPGTIWGWISLLSSGPHFPETQPWKVSAEALPVSCHKWGARSCPHFSQDPVAQGAQLAGDLQPLLLCQAQGPGGIGVCSQNQFYLLAFPCSWAQRDAHLAFCVPVFFIYSSCLLSGILCLWNRVE